MPNNVVLYISFQHQMSLRRNATEFAERVREAPISGNIDNPEGGFDALMQVMQLKKLQIVHALYQVMVCGDRIGWRKEARRVIIYTTDQVKLSYSWGLISHFGALRVFTLLAMESLVVL